jgi:hypothetical protein
MFTVISNIVQLFLVRPPSSIAQYFCLVYESLSSSLLGHSEEGERGTQAGFRHYIYLHYYSYLGFTSIKQSRLDGRENKVNNF